MSVLSGREYGFSLSNIPSIVENAFSIIYKIAMACSFSLMVSLSESSSLSVLN